MDEMTVSVPPTSNYLAVPPNSPQISENDSVMIESGVGQGTMKIHPQFEGLTSKDHIMYLMPVPPCSLNAKFPQMKKRRD